MARQTRTSVPVGSTQDLETRDNERSWRDV